MSTLQQDLDDLVPTPPIRALATELDKRTAIESDRQTQYVSLRPSLDGAVAVYLHKTWISVALPPERATQVVGLVPGSTLDTKTPATTYWHVTAEAVAGAADTVLDVIHEAVDWRANGPKSSVGVGHAKKAEKELGSCPEHWMELLPSGKCWECG